MVSFPNCKINIGLRVVNKRPDGFHDIESVFIPIALKDAVEIISDQSLQKEVSFSSSGLPIPGNEADNLCVKAYQLLKKDFPELDRIKMHLHKAIPMGAGLGGGSADASFILKMINEKFDLKLSTKQLIDYALQLGSDCPFFIINKPCYATRRGEILEEISIDLSAFKILLVNPGLHINTSWAFSQVKIDRVDNSLKDLVKLPVIEWQQHIFNDFEIPVCTSHPEIAAIKKTMLRSGSIFTSMSGSGSTVFGIFDQKTTPDCKFPAHYICKWV